ncbi:MAG: lipid-binding SYLF domain-containing protein [Pseudomonadota bacterium]
MKHCRITMLLAAMILAAWTVPAVADKYEDTIAVFKRSPQVQPFFENAYGYAVFPLVGKGGIVVGGSYGDGQVYQNNSLTGTAKLAKVSVGFQVGGQAFAEIIFFENKRAYDDFTGGAFEFNASASAVAVTLSAQAQTGTTGNSAGASYTPSEGVQVKTGYNDGMIVFVHAIGGLMYEASIGGQRFIFRPLK